MNDVQLPAHATAEGVMERVQALGTLIDTSANANEQATEIAPEVIDALIEAGVFKLMVPRVLGGLEAEPEVLIDAISTMSYHDGSTGWYVGAVMTAGAV